MRTGVTDSVAPDLDAVRFGVPLGPETQPTPIEVNRRHPMTTLISAISRSLDDSPCFVGFSGGCDSSLVLSAATRACRSVGHPDPIPVTYRYTAAETDEREFQELLVRHLGLRDWHVVEFGDDADLLSPTTCQELADGGSMWPATPLTRARALRELGGGLWLTGEGGDEILGPKRTSYAVRALQVWARRPLHPPRVILRRGLTDLGPKRVRARAVAAGLARDYEAKWLEPDLRRAYFEKAASLTASAPLRPSRWFAHHLATPQVRIGHASLRAFKARFGLRWTAPLVDADFLGSLAGTVRWHEYRGRRHLLRELFSDLLPAAIVDRRGKVAFNNAFFGVHTRAFAQRWDGTGTPEGVDAHWLKEHWQSPTVSAGTAPLLHHVWLASEGPRAENANGAGSCR